MPAREIELKLEVPSVDRRQLAHLPFLKSCPAKTEKLDSVYFDTHKRKLRCHGLSLRVRHTDGRYVQTIKQSGGQGAGLFERGEWESRIGGARPDFHAARGTALEPLLGKKLRRKLKPVFETQVRRTIYPIRHNGSTVELAVDIGRIKARSKSAALCEIELELKDGRPDELFARARLLEASVPAVLSSKSKADRGYDLITGAKPAPAKAQSIAIPADADWCTAFQIVARACLFQVAANFEPVKRGEPEGVHQMRVGLRRLRAAISLFKSMLAGAQTEAIKSELKWLTNELGPARELDVFVTRVVKHNGHSLGSDALAEDLRCKHADALARARAAACSSRFRYLLLDVAAWVEAGDWLHGRGDKPALRAQSAVKAAANEMGRRRRKIRKRGAELTELDPGRRHKLRIATKKIRYASEFFASMFAGKKAERRRKTFIARLKELQGALGDLNDIVAHQRLAKDEAKPLRSDRTQRHRLPEAFAAGRLSGRESARFGTVMRDAERAYAAFAKASPFWF